MELHDIENKLNMLLAGSGRKIAFWYDDDDEYEEDCDDYSYDRDEPTYDRYNGSYAQDEMGYSDDDIDTIFDGDPEAYWNID